MARIGLEWSRPDRNGMDWKKKMERIATDRIGLGLEGLNWNHRHWVGTEWDETDRAGLEWNATDWIETERDGQYWDGSGGVGFD